MGVDINFIDYFAHKTVTVKAQLSPIYLIKRFKGFWGGEGRGGCWVGVIRGMKKGFYFLNIKGGN